MVLTDRGYNYNFIDTVLGITFTLHLSTDGSCMEFTLWGRHGTELRHGVLWRHKTKASVHQRQEVPQADKHMFKLDQTSYNILKLNLLVKWKG